jgi:LysM repeat protein
MKQNERWLVYAVTGFLGLILVAAVLFSRGTSPGGDATKKPVGLGQITGLGGPSVGEKATGDGNRTGVPAPSEGIVQQPLVAANKPMLAADLVSQQLGASRRDRNVRFVRAKQGDSLDLLVQRWCGGRDPFLAEAKCLNEELVVLRVGQEVAVPWVDDEVVLAAAEARKPKTLLANDASGSPATRGEATPATSRRPDFVEPGADLRVGAGSGTAGQPTPASATGTRYTVKYGDSLWRIADRTYGRKNADRMLPVIKDANPGLGDDIKVGQKIVLPTDPEAKATPPSGS